MNMGKGTPAARQLRQYIESIERLEEEKKALMDDIKEKFAEARGAGFDVKTMRTIIKRRKKSLEELDEEQSLLDTYLHALEAFDGTPMGEHIAAQGAPLQ